MNKQQEYILWIGIGLLLIYLFTDVSVRNTLFNRKTGTKPANTFADSVTAFIQGSTGTPSSTGNGHSNTGNTGKIVLA